MEKKEILRIKTKEFYELLMVKDVDFMSAHKLFNQVYNFIHCRYQVQTAKTPEATSLAKWGLEIARDELNRTLYAMNLCYLDAVLVRWIAEYCDYEEK